MPRRDEGSLCACRRAHRFSTGMGFWTLFWISAGVGLHPLPSAAQTDFGPVIVNPFFSLESAQPVIGSAQSEESNNSGLLKGTLFGAAIGAGVGLIVYEVASSQLGICSNSPNSTCTTSPTAVQAAVAGGLVGALVGALIGSRGSSSQDWTPMPRLGASLDGAWSLNVSIPAGGGSGPR